jgi:hypothetical protein
MSERAKLKTISAAADRRDVAFSNALSALWTLQRARRAGSRKEARGFFAEVAAVEIFSGMSQLIKMAPSILKNLVGIGFGRLSYASLLSELHQPICTIFADDRSAGETTARHLSPYHDNRLSADFYAPGAPDLRVRFASAATRW